MSGEPAVEVSVIMPAYNAEQTLGDQLTALSRQQAPFRWELLVCDNGSTDRTRELALASAGRLDRVRVVDASARRGPSAARNIGAEQAEAPLLVFCDADDVVGDGWLVQMHDALQRSAAVAGSVETDSLNSHGDASVSWSPGGVVTKPFWPEFSASGAASLGVQEPVFRALGGFDETLRTGEDVDFCWRLQLAGQTLAECPEAVVHVRKRVGVRSTFRQAYSWGEGDRQLKHKFAPLIAAYRRDHPVAVADRPSARSSRRDLGATGARIARILTPGGRADAASRIGEWMGSHFARVDNSVPQYDAGLDGR